MASESFIKRQLDIISDDVREQKLTPEKALDLAPVVINLLTTLARIEEDKKIQGEEEWEI